MVSIPGEKNLSIKMNDEFIKRLDKIAHMVKRPRNQLVKNILETGVEELEKFRVVGVFQLGVFIRDLHESISMMCNLKKHDPVAGDKTIPIKLDDEFIERLSHLASKAGLTRHQLAKNLLRIGVEEGETIAKLGVLQFMVFMRDLPESFRKICKKGEAALKVEEK